MKAEELDEAIARAQLEINDQLNDFREKFRRATEDPANFITMTALESEWRKLRLSTCQTYSDLVSQALSSCDMKELNDAKKANSSRTESD